MRNLNKETIEKWRKHGFTHIETLNEEQDEETGIRHLLVQPTHEPGSNSISIEDADFLTLDDEAMVVQYLPLQHFEITIGRSTFLICEELFSDREISYSVSLNDQPEIPTFHLRINENGLWRIIDPEELPEKIRDLEDRLSDAILSQNL